MRFTDRGLQALKPTDKRQDIYAGDRSGLGIRVMPTGSKTFFYRYQLNGRRNSITIGRYPDTSLKKAREVVAEYRKQLNAGVDPGIARQAEKAEQASAPIVAHLCDLYLERYAKRHKKSWLQDERRLRREVSPRWGKRRVVDIKRRDVIALLDDIVDRGSPAEANRVFGLLRSVFNFAIDRDLLEVNPCYRLKPPGGKERARDRVLSEKEIRLLWRRLPRSGMTFLHVMALKIMLATGQRRGEVMAAKWGDIEGGIWTIPITKSERLHEIPLSPVAAALFRHLHRRAGWSKWCFPSPQTDDHLSVSRVTCTLPKARQYLGIDHFTAHDLRRSAASHMAKAGTSRLVVGMVLNHADSSVTAIYDRYSYDKELRQALDRWGRVLMGYLRPESVADNVLEMRRG